jgi:hypothetical protein
MEIVNGYPCLTCSDVAKAKRNIDPAASPLQAVAEQSERVEPAAAASQPLAAGVRGTQVNLLL